MPNLKYYNTTTSQWETLVVGAKGETGATGIQGPTGPAGADGVSVPDGGTEGQVLGKASSADYDFEWIDGGGRFAIQLNEQSITANYAMPSGFNGVSAGPITIASGVVVTIPAGSSWSIV
jgi:hypothetical protein